MKYDLRILWIEDSPDWREEQKEILIMHIEDFGLSCDIQCEIYGKSVLDKLDRENEGFKLYDIFLIDYSLSGSTGDELISKFRELSIDSDILFYSSDREKEIRSKVSDNLNDFEGVYIANRDNFMDKCVYLIKKNAKGLLSISNIRGFLMDQTSENDFIIKSYISDNYDELTEDEQNDIHNTIVNFYDDKSEFSIDLESDIKKIENTKSGGRISDINQFLRFPSHVVPQKLKYLVFQKIIEIRKNSAFGDKSIRNYIEEIITSRNKLAHKKLEICKQQKYIQYCDTLKQYLERCCKENCDSHTNEHKISLDEWQVIRKNVIVYANCFNNIMSEIVDLQPEKHDA